MELSLLKGLLNLFTFFTHETKEGEYVILTPKHRARCYNVKEKAFTKQDIACIEVFSNQEKFCEFSGGGDLIIHGPDKTAVLTIDLKWFKHVEQRRTTVKIILYVCTHYL